MSRTLRVTMLLVLGSLLGTALGQPLAALRLSHLSPDAPRVDLVIDHQLFLRDLGYGQVTPYTTLPAGQHEISVWPHRLPNQQQPSEEDGVPALTPVTILLELDEGMYYTLALSGFYARQARLDGGSLEVDVAPEEALVTVRGPRGFTRSFSGDSRLGDLEPGNYTIRAELAGFSPATFEITVHEADTANVSITLQEGEGGVTDSAPPPAEAMSQQWRPIELHAFRDELDEAPRPGASRIRLLHLSPGTMSIDLLALPLEGGGEPVTIAAALAFPNASAYSRLPAGEYTLQIRMAGADAILAQVQRVRIEPGGTYTFFLVREPADNFLRLIPAVDALLMVRR